MTLQALLNNRYEWSDRTIYELKRGLLLYENKDDNYDNRKDSKFVVIYGTSQIGKTTLILNLLGIVNENFNTVYDVLRANREHGNSSTSTAIIYRQSSDDKFGLAFIDDVSTIATDIKKYSATQFKEQLSLLREQIEAKTISNDILLVSIPKMYFSEKAKQHSNIDILDMPGDGSRDENEQKHLKYLLQSYMSISSVNIITCSAHNITALENLIMANEDSDRWSKIPSKYMIVTTYSYSEGTVISHFNKKRTYEGFYDYIRQSAQEDLEKVLPGSNVEIFPVDVGDSYETLLKSLSPNDKKEVENTRDKIFENIRQSIQTRHGNYLKTIVATLKENIEALAELKEKEITDEIDEDTKILEEKKSILENKQEREVALEELKSINNKIEQYTNFMLSENDIQINSKGEREKVLLVAENGYSDKREFKEESLLSAYSNGLRTIQRNCVSDVLSQIENVFPNFVIIEPQLNNFDNFSYNIDDAVNKFKHYYYENGRFFHFKNRPQLSFVKERIKSDYNEQNKKIWEIVSNKVTALQRLEIKKETETKQDWEAKINELNRKDKILQQKIDVINKSIQENNENLNSVREKKQKDKERLDHYLLTASNVFTKYKQNCLKEIHDTSFSPAERVEKLLYLGIIQNDYKRIMKVKNEINEK